MKKMMCLFLLLICLSFLMVSCVTNSKQFHTLKIEAGIGGTIPGGIEKLINGDYKNRAKISIEARPMPGNYFVNWTSSNGGKFADKNNSQTTFTMPGNDTIITANFKPLE